MLNLVERCGISPRALRERDPDWEFFLPDEGETAPEPGDFWIEDEEEEES